MANQPSSLQNNFKSTLEISVRLILLFLLIAWCLVLLMPFISPVLWGIIIAVSVAPIYTSINKKLKDKPRLTASILVIFFLLILLIPAYFIIDSAVYGMHEIGTKLQEGNFKVPPPTDRIKELPVIGHKLFDIWAGFSENIESAIAKYSDQVMKIGKWFLNIVMSLTIDIVKFILSIIIAGILLATKGTQDLTEKFYMKVVGERGKEFKQITEVTISNVTKGVLGVAFIQSILLGVLFKLAGVPYAGVWTILCLILSIIQLSPSIISIPVIFYLYSTLSPTVATVWTILIILAGLSDNVLKPILLGKGAPVPMLVIFLGSLGGFITSGFIGLFTGAIVLSIGYKLFIAWLNEKPTPTTPANSGEEVTSL